MVVVATLVLGFLTVYVLMMTKFFGWLVQALSAGRLTEDETERRKLLFSFVLTGGIIWYLLRLYQDPIIETTARSSR
jgi:hypothetical protein